MGSWEELVTTALLGTDRRPVPDAVAESWGALADPESDPARRVLAHAAAHRAAVRAGRVADVAELASEHASGHGAEPSPDPRPPADAAARQALSEHLEAGAVDEVAGWLEDAVSRGLRPGAEHWTGLAALAARSRRIDRSTLARALGAPGIGFVARNPRWARLAGDLRIAATSSAS